MNTAPIRLGEHAIITEAEGMTRKPERLYTGRELLERLWVDRPLTVDRW